AATGLAVVLPADRDEAGAADRDRGVPPEAVGDERMCRQELVVLPGHAVVAEPARAAGEARGDRRRLDRLPGDDEEVAVADRRRDRGMLLVAVEHRVE